MYKTLKDFIAKSIIQEVALNLMTYADFFIHEILHSLAYLVLALPVLYFYRDTLKLFIGFVVTILLDVDHFFDYLIYKNWLSFNLHEFFHTDYFNRNGTIYLPFHAWEWVALVLAFYFATKRKYNVLLFIAVGIAAQLIWDTLTYGFDPRVYFITQRALLDFTQSIFIPVRMGL